MWFGKTPFCLGKIGSEASQAITLCYFRQSQPELASGTIQLLRRHTEITYLRGNARFIVPVLFRFQSAEAARSRPGARMNDERMCS